MQTTIEEFERSFNNYFERTFKWYCRLVLFTVFVWLLQHLAPGIAVEAFALYLA